MTSTDRITSPIDFPGHREHDIDPPRSSNGPRPLTGAINVGGPPNHTDPPDATAVDGGGDEAPAPIRNPPTTNRSSYQSVGEVSGRSLSEAVYWLALSVIAGADVAAFYQVVAVVNPTGQGWLIWLLVAGFTVASLTLAHFAGRGPRVPAAARGGARRSMVFALAGPWLALGLVAFIVRGIKASSTSASTAEAAALASKQQLAAAVMFLVLYLASGFITFFGVYLTRNPLRVAYRRALRAHRQTLKRLAMTQPPYERAIQVRRLHARNRAREPMNFNAARDQRLAFADELKRYSAARMAILLKTPSTTDGMTLPDRLPLAYPEPEPAPEPDPEPQPEPERHGDAVPESPTGAAEDPSEKAEP